MEANVANANMEQWAKKNRIRRSVDARQNLTDQIWRSKFLVGDTPNIYIGSALLQAVVSTSSPCQIVAKLLLSLSYVEFCHLIHIWVTPKAAGIQRLVSCTGEDCWHLREPVVIFCHFALNAVLGDHGCSRVKLMAGSSRSNMIFPHHATDLFCSNSTQWLLLFRDSFWILNFKAQLVSHWGWAARIKSTVFRRSHSFSVLSDNAPNLAPVKVFYL